MIKQSENSLTSIAIERVQTAIEAIAQGKMVIMIDDEQRENEGDLVFAAEHTSCEHINFMAKEARGLICLSLNREMTQKLELPLMVDEHKNHAALSTAFTISIDAKEGISTGISANDRAKTIIAATKDGASAKDLVTPGHIFPLQAKNGGVLERAGHTEGSIDLSLMAGKKPSAVICEIMRDDGQMARNSDLKEFSLKHQIPIVSIADLITYRLSYETLVYEVKRKTLSLEGTRVEAIWFKSKIDSSIHFAMVKGPIDPSQTTHVRVHKQNALLDTFSWISASSRTTHEKMNYALNILKDKPQAAIVFLSNNDPENILKALDDDQPQDPFLYGTGAQILKALGIKEMALHIQSEKNLVAIRGFGLDVKERIVINPQH